VKGYHLLLDLKGCPEDKLADKERLYWFLDTLPAEIGMRKAASPTVLRVDDVPPSEVGVTGFVVLKESHISAHAFEKLGDLTADIYSCKMFDQEYVIEKFYKEFSPGSVTSQFIHRL
jgi:S-adenosylmethionine decarboxylase